MSSRPLTVHRLDRLARSEKPPMLIDGVLGQRAIHIWSGLPYAGKTFLAIEAMRAVAEAKPFLGHFNVPRAGNVLYLGNDSPDWDVAQQFGKIVGIPDPEVMEAAIADTSAGAYGFILDPTFALSDAADAQRLVDAAKSFASARDYDYVNDTWTGLRGTSLIVIDTLRSVHGFEQNDNTEMQHVVNLIRYVSEQTGSAVLCLHHFNKSSPGERDRVTLERIIGAVAITGGVDSVLALQPKGESVAVRVLKHRVAPQQKDFMYQMVDNGPGRVVLSLSSDVGVVNPTALVLIRQRLEGALLAVDPDARWVKTSDFVTAVAKLPGMEAGTKAQSAVTHVLRQLEKNDEVERIHGATRLKRKEA